MQKRAKCTLGGTLGGTSEAGGGMQTQARERAGSRSCARGSYTHLAMEARQKGEVENTYTRTKSCGYTQGSAGNYTLRLP
mmetsp:Transcript_16182/g.34411  ORF Transcript_16182/g.34411 Transcript_16182/m.34411 type:complete len:80 (+) Transcript_16182:195-434(+)